MSHQPLAGVSSADDAEEVQTLLGRHSEKIVLAINGHTHVDQLVEEQGVRYLHINSASYKWMGGKYQHASYSEDIHKAHKSIRYTCPYKDSVFARLVFDPAKREIRVEGRQSQWVGPSPQELGKPDPVEGVVIPGVRSRKITVS